MSKKITAIILAASMLVSMSACKPKENETATDTDTYTDTAGETTSEEETLPPREPCDPIDGIAGYGMTMTKGEVNQNGNTPANINNRGVATMQGDWIYYTTFRGIHRVRQNGKDEQLICGMSDAVGLNAVGDWIYFVGGAAWDIYRMKNNGTELQVVLKMPEGTVAAFLNVVGDMMYFSAMGEGAGYIHSVTVEGKDRKELNQAESHNINVIGNTIFFSNAEDDYSVYSMNLDGTKLQKVTNYDSEHMNIIGDWVIFVYDDEEAEEESLNIYRILRRKIYDEEDETIEQRLIRINAVPSTDVNVIGDWIFYINTDDGCIYRVDINGDNISRLNDISSASLAIVGDWIYYTGQADGVTGMYRMKLNGDKNKKID
ncbi:MAG: DUF5050 domain-containing protein [Oscillospiraceae bacterium]|nr:DUF5050 domain-containing protein [Oscillospiraceae bacterium]